MTVDVEHYDVMPPARRGQWSRQLEPICLAALTAVPGHPRSD